MWERREVSKSICGEGGEEKGRRGGRQVSQYVEREGRRNVGKEGGSKSKFGEGREKKL